MECAISFVLGLRIREELLTTIKEGCQIGQAESQSLWGLLCWEKVGKEGQGLAILQKAMVQKNAEAAFFMH